MIKYRIFAAAFHDAASVEGEFQGRAESCLIYDTDFPQMNRPAGKEQINNWVHFSGDNLPVFFDTLQIPVNRIFTPAHCDFIEPAIQNMLREYYRRGHHWKEIAGGMMGILLMQLSRELLDETEETGPVELRVDRASLFRRLREDVQRDYRRNWSVAEMAQRVHVSSPRFAVIYRSMFRVSPMEDLIRTRLSRAAELLFDRSMTVEAVADACGFGSVIYFHRQFRKHYHCTPRQYLKRK